MPNAWQLKFVCCPVAVISREIGWIRNLGFEGSTIENARKTAQGGPQFIS